MDAQHVERRVPIQMVDAVPHGQIEREHHVAGDQDHVRRQDSEQVDGKLLDGLVEVDQIAGDQQERGHEKRQHATLNIGVDIAKIDNMHKDDKGNQYGSLKVYLVNVALGHGGQLLSFRLAWMTLMNSWVKRSAPWLLRCTSSLNSSGCR